MTSAIVSPEINQSVPAEVEGEDYLVTPLNLVIEGQYFEVLGFIYGLEDLGRIVVIKSIALNSSENEEGFTILQGNIGAESYTTADLTVPAPEEPSTEESEGATTTTVPGDTTTTTTTGGDE